MASTKKQDKPSTVPEQATPVAGDQPVTSSLIVDTAGAVMPIDREATAAAGAALGVSATQEVASATATSPEDSAPVTALTTSSPGASPGESSPTDGTPVIATEPSSATDSASTLSVDLNPVTVAVYPLRSFMDEGELRRRGGPSYQVPRLHAEELEQRKLVSRTPLEE